MAKHGPVAQRVQDLARAVEQRPVTLDREHPGTQLAEYGRLVATARAYLEDAVVGPDVQHHRLVCHRERLRNGLTEPDGQRFVFIRAAAKGVVDKLEIGRASCRERV